MEYKNKKIAIILGIFTLSSIITFYYVNKQIITVENPQTINSEVFFAVEMCRSLCIFAKENLSLELNSQCLSDPDTITGRYWIVENWACDIVNFPRKPTDDLEYNQCEEYLIGAVKNFVEVDTNCIPVRAYYRGNIIELRQQ